jgi:acyl carrier protein
MDSELERQRVAEFLRGLISEVMYMEPEEIGDDMLFSDFGLESITLVKLITKVNANYACSIEPREILPHQTLREASAFIAERLRPASNNVGAP